MKNLYNDKDQYNIDETSKWDERIENEVFPLVDNMMDAGYSGAEIRQFLAEEIAFHMSFRNMGVENGNT